MRRALIGLGVLFGAVVIFVVVVGILVFASGPSLEAECDDRAVNTTGLSSAAFDDTWDAFDDRVASGVTTTVGFSEAEATQRSRAFLLEKNIDEIREVTICFFGGVGEARGKGAIPVLPDITAKIRGRIVLNGTVPVLEIEDIDIGSAGFLIDLFGLEGEIEDAVNLALDDLFLENAPYGVRFAAGTVTISGG